MKKIFKSRLITNKIAGTKLATRGLTKVVRFSHER